MRPYNFPERKNRRRKHALERLRAIPYGEPRSKRDITAGTSANIIQRRRDKEIAALETRIVPSARDIRTKKAR